MKAKKVEGFIVNGKIFMINSDGILVQCQELSITKMPTFAEYEAIFDLCDEKTE